MKHFSYGILLANVAGTIWFATQKDFTQAGVCMMAIVALFTTAPHKVGQ